MQVADRGFGQLIRIGQGQIGAGGAVQLGKLGQLPPRHVFDPVLQLAAQFVQAVPGFPPLAQILGCVHGPCPLGS